MKPDSEMLKTGATWLGATSGIAVPAFSFFSSYPPPLFPSVSLITAALSTGILLITLAWKPAPDPKTAPMPRVLRRARGLLIFSVILLISYICVLHITTEKIPNTSKSRIQLGFGKAAWSLTEKGKSWIHTDPDITLVQMLKAEAAFSQDRVGILWQQWSVIAAGALVMLLFFFAFCVWTTAFALLAKHRQDVRQRAAKVRATGQ